jgi:hypothetical protein
MDDRRDRRIYMVYRLRLLGHRIEAYAAMAAV